MVIFLILLKGNKIFDKKLTFLLFLCLGIPRCAGLFRILELGFMKIKIYKIVIHRSIRLKSEIKKS